MDEYEKLGHKMRPAGVLANHGELQCFYCGATTLTTMGHPKDFKCPKNPDKKKDTIVVILLGKEIEF